MATPRPRALLVYHFFFPDDVVSARLFTELAEGLVDRGWDITALTSDRVWADSARIRASRERWRGITIERVRRPGWDQSRPSGRLLNSLWMLTGWLHRARRMESFDAVVIGSDPAFAATLFLPMRRLWPDAALAHWCYDVYPDAIVADGAGPLVRLVVRAVSEVMKASYQRCDAIVDLGPRMRARLSNARILAQRETLVPWALAVPSDAPRPPRRDVRQLLFGDAKLALLYSGTLGRAHDFGPILSMARAVRQRNGNNIAFCFITRGHGLESLKQSIKPQDTNIRVFPFAAESTLDAQLESADIHLLSLRDEWSGIVVPSKFFGSLAVGRPVLYFGPQDSDIAHWIHAFDVGWNATQLGARQSAVLLEQLLDGPSALESAQRRAREAYDKHFGKDYTISRWDSLLRKSIADRANADRRVRQ